MYSQLCPAVMDAHSFPHIAVSAHQAAILIDGTMLICWTEFGRKVDDHLLCTDVWARGLSMVHT